MTQPTRFAVVAIPLNRADIARFLLTRSTTPRGARLHILAQRPTEAVEAAWLARIESTSQPTIEQLLEIDDPHGHLLPTWTDRLVPVEFLHQAEFLTRNLGGWAPVYFGVVGLPAVSENKDKDKEHRNDPLLHHLEVLRDYGGKIRYFGAEPTQVQARLQQEMEADFETVVAALRSLSGCRQQMQGRRIDYIERLYATLNGENRLPGAQLWPKMLLFDELLGQLVRLELIRRDYLANGHHAQAASIKTQQEAWKDEFGLLLILKGEYIAGRQRRSTVLIASELGVVVKQPAPEPWHEIELGAKMVQGKAENWPYSTHDGALVTARGRIRLILEENIVPQLSSVLKHRIDFSTFLGLSVEPFVNGPTVQELILNDARQMTPQLYDEFILNQQVCEMLGGENGDWHSANFVRRQTDGELIHIDWGAARPLKPDEHTPQAQLARLNQVQNLAFSFHDEALAQLVTQQHTDLMADAERLANIQRRARALVGEG